MATYFTKSEARGVADLHRRRLAKSAPVIFAEGNASLQREDSFDVFLSHAKLDADLVLGVKLLLEDKGLSVYVDWDTDQNLDRSAVSEETAQLLRVRMQQSKSLLYVATENASNSKWMPWELGYFDGLHQGGVAVFPLLDRSDASFPNQEYLGLYPVVTKDTYSDRGTIRNDVFVEEPGKRWTFLKSFASGNASWNPNR